MIFLSESRLGKVGGVKTEFCFFLYSVLQGFWCRGALRRTRPSKNTHIVKSFKMKFVFRQTLIVLLNASEGCVDIC